jgi:hypothetical protein
VHLCALSISRHCFHQVVGVPFNPPRTLPVHFGSRGQLWAVRGTLFTVVLCPAAALTSGWEPRGDTSRRRRKHAYLAYRGAAPTDANESAQTLARVMRAASCW